MRENKFEITGASLKWIAIITMFIDHFAATVLENYLTYAQYNTAGGAAGGAARGNGILSVLLSWETYSFLRDVGRLAFPIFIFLMVEGFFYTRSRKKYLIRMLIFSAVSEIPFDLAFNYGWTFSSASPVKLPEFVAKVTRYLPIEFTSQNVFFTLTIGFAAIWLCNTIMDYAPQGPYPFLSEAIKILLLFAVILGGSFLAELLETDYSGMGVIAMIACFLIKKKGGKPYMAMTATVFMLVLMSSNELPAVLDIAFVAFYHGTKGKNINKWFFYLFYPVHLTLLWAIAYFFFTRNYLY